MKHRATFFLKEPTAARETPINAHLYVNRKRFKIATGLLIHPKHWDFDRQRVKRGSILQTVINDRLDEIDVAIAVIYEELRRARIEITPEAIRERYLVKHGMVKAPEEVSFLERYEQFIKSAEGRLQRGTIQVHGTARNHLRTFAEKRGVTLSYEIVDAAFLRNFVVYLVGEIKLNNTSAWKVVRTIRVFLRHSVENGLAESTDFRKVTRAQIERGEKSLAVYLTPDELQRIMALDLSKDKRLERARDLFVFQAHTGMRFGDVCALRPEQIQGETIAVVTHKNRKAIRIPFLPVVRTIWEKYGGRLPVITNQRQNDYVKELAAKANIDTPVVTIDYRGTERIEEVLPKHELISTHTAKRTFVTILRSRGVSVEAIMRATGNSRRTIETYIVTTEDDVHREITSAWQKPAANARKKQKRAVKGTEA